MRQRELRESMISIRIPAPIALDTAALNVWAREWARGDPKARRLLQGLAELSAHLLITYHQVVELAAHESDETVGDRARFVRALRSLYWIKDRASGGLGGLLDLHVAEILARVVSHCGSHQEIVSHARQDVLAFGDADPVAELLEDSTFKAYARARVQPRRAIESIARTTIAVPSMTQQRVDSKLGRVPLTTVQRNFERQQKHLASQLKAKGDKKLVEPGPIAEQFFDELRREVAAVEEGGSVALADVLRRIGIMDIDLANPVCADELGEKYVWKRRSEILARLAGLPASVVEEIRCTEIPSLHLCDEIVAYHQRAHRAEGGNSGDASLACLSLYAHVTSVDKRTDEYVRQIRRRSRELDSVMGRIVRLPNLEAIERSIPIWNGYGEE